MIHTIFKNKVLNPLLDVNPYEEFIKCQQSFSYFAKQYVKVSDPISGVVPFPLYSFQEELLSLYEKHDNVISTKFRSGGFTTISVLYGLWKCMFNANIIFFVGCKTQREAQHVGKIIDITIDLFPDWFKPKLNQNTKRVKSFANTKSKLIFDNIDNIRGIPATHIFIDEAAFIPNMEDKWKIIAAISQRSKIFVNSTANGLGNWFEITFSNAMSGHNDFVTYHPDYMQHPKYSDETYVMELKKNLGEKGWQQEMLGNFVYDPENYQTDDVAPKLTDTILVNRVSGILSQKVSYEDKAALYELLNRFTQRA